MAEHRRLGEQLPVQLLQLHNTPAARKQLPFDDQQGQVRPPPHHCHQHYPRRPTTFYGWIETTDSIVQADSPRHHCQIRTHHLSTRLRRRSRSYSSCANSSPCPLDLGGQLSYRCCRPLQIRHPSCRSLLVKLCSAGGGRLRIHPGDTPISSVLLA
jgi:hypothetical protein